MKIVYSTTGSRVKALQVHTTRPWLLCGRISGEVEIWDYQTGERVRAVHAGDAAVRAVCWLERLNAFAVGDDDGFIRVYNAFDGALRTSVQGHTDFVRALAVHPTEPVLYSASDDTTVISWSLDPSTLLAPIRVFCGHELTVMALSISQNAEEVYSTSLDGTIKVWPALLTTASRSVPARASGVRPTNGFIGPNYTIKVGVQSSAVSVVGAENVAVGSDDGEIRLYDRSTKDPIKVAAAHTKELTAVLSEPSLPGIFTGAEDGTVTIIDNRTFDIIDTLALGSRVWCLANVQSRRAIAVGTDNGWSLVKPAVGAPALALQGAKIFTAVGAAGAAGGVGNGDRVAFGQLTTAARDLTTPLSVPFKIPGQPLDHPVQTLAPAPSGRLLLAAGGGKYTILSAIVGREQSAGACVDAMACWAGAAGATVAAVETASPATGTLITIAQGDAPITIQLPVVATALRGGPLMSVIANGTGNVMFIHPSGLLVREVNVSAPEDVIWAPGSRRLCIRAASNLYFLAYEDECVRGAVVAGVDAEVEAAFAPLTAISGTFTSVAWIDDGCVATITDAGKIDVHFIPSVPGERMDARARPAGSLPPESTLIDYISSADAVLAVAADGSIRCGPLEVSALEFWRAVARRDAAAAVAAAGKVRPSEATAAAQALVGLGAAAEAVKMLPPSQARINAALAAGDLAEAANVAAAVAAAAPGALSASAAWSSVISGAIDAGDVDVLLTAGRAAAPDTALLLSVCLGDNEDIRAAGKAALDAGAANAAFTAGFVARDTELCLAALSEDPAARAQFARAYAPEHVAEALAAWKKVLAAENMEVIGNSLLMPE